MALLRCGGECCLQAVEIEVLDRDVLHPAGHEDPVSSPTGQIEQNRSIAVKSRVGWQVDGVLHADARIRSQ